MRTVTAILAFITLFIAACNTMTVDPTGTSYFHAVNKRPSACYIKTTALSAEDSIIAGWQMISPNDTISLGTATSMGPPSPYQVFSQIEIAAPDTGTVICVDHPLDTNHWAHTLRYVRDARTDLDFFYSISP